MANDIKTYTAELFIKEKHTLGESPFYDARTKTLLIKNLSEYYKAWRAITVRYEKKLHQASKLDIIFITYR